MRTSAEIDTVPSLMPRSIAMCEWQSTAPGARCRPSASITVAPSGAAMAQWRERMFSAMARNAGSITDYFNIPTNRVIELGTRVQI